MIRFADLTMTAIRTHKDGRLSITGCNTGIAEVVGTIALDPDQLQMLHRIIHRQRNTAMKRTYTVPEWHADTEDEN